MGVDQLPGRVREFANYLNGLLARLDQGAGWCAVFWQRDPDGMQACLDGVEVPPWDVVEALLQDFAAEHGTPAAARDADLARSLHAAALAAYDARPGGRDALGDRLDVMLREQRYAVERQAELGRLLGAAATQEDAEAIRLDLAWAHDDHERAVARCAELRYRMAELDRRQGEGQRSGPHPTHGPAGRVPTRGSGHMAGAAGGPTDLAYDAEPSAGGRGAADSTAHPAASSHPAPSSHPETSPHAAGSPRAAGSPHPAAASHPAGSLHPDPSPQPVHPSAPAPVAPHDRAPASGSFFDRAPGSAAAFTPASGPGSVFDPAPGSAAPRAPASGSVFDPAPAPGSAAAFVPASGSGSVFDPAPGSAAASAPASGPGSFFDPAPAPGSAAPFAPASVPAPAPDPEPVAVQGPASIATPTPTPTPREEAEPLPAPSKQRKRRRGGARFAGVVQEEDAVVVPPTVGTEPPEPAPAGRRTLRGARFAGAAARAERREEPQREPLDAEARRETVRAVERLVGLRAEGRSGEAHALLVELAYWPAARIPLLAAELQRAGLSADWTTLLWEAASLPADRLVEAADALAAVGRTVDGEQILRQGVARPAEEIGRSVLALHSGGRRREARALLDAYVRVRSPEEAARSAAPAPQTLVPLLLEAARGVSEQRRWDLVHALRVAGLTV
ncbi:hypothetical protein [Streptomyces sp. NBC_00582]|uniref:hypothetical protein n=1 Tax=Streptomyces sp. NBC_00582 TaxID=2975783 RepID=UPI002E81460A|nr:hypothetical protein [Streptomyces sp. NBC_00582]WUB60708.1 hypothetical protein OG852_10090 [Streptomyces sp. NBC_00582]